MIGVQGIVFPSVVCRLRRPTAQYNQMRSSGVDQAWVKAARSDIFSKAQPSCLPGDEMSAKIVSDMVSRRKVFSTIGLSVVLGLLRHHEHEPRSSRHERRDTRRTVHTVLS
jgi:hypothetical protein